MNYNDVFEKAFSSVEPKTSNADFISSIEKKAEEMSKSSGSGHAVRLTEITVEQPVRKPVSKRTKVFVSCAAAAAVLAAGFAVFPMLRPSAKPEVFSPYANSPTTGVPETMPASAQAAAAETTITAKEVDIVGTAVQMNIPDEADEITALEMFDVNESFRFDGFDFTIDSAKYNGYVIQLYSRLIFDDEETRQKYLSEGLDSFIKNTLHIGLTSDRSGGRFTAIPINELADEGLTVGLGFDLYGAEPADTVSVTVGRAYDPEEAFTAVIPLPDVTGHLLKAQGSGAKLKLMNGSETAASLAVDEVILLDDALFDEKYNGAVVLRGIMDSKLPTDTSDIGASVRLIDANAQVHTMHYGFTGQCEELPDGTYSTDIVILPEAGSDFDIDTRNVFALIIGEEKEGTPVIMRDELNIRAIDGDILKLDAFIAGALADGSGNTLSVTWTVFSMDKQTPAHDYVLFIDKSPDIYLGETTLEYADTHEWRYRTEFKLRPGVNPQEQTINIASQEMLDSFIKAQSEGQLSAMGAYGAFTPEWKDGLSFEDGLIQGEGGIVGTTVDTGTESNESSGVKQLITHRLDQRYSFENISDAGNISVYLKEYMYDGYTARIYYDVTFEDAPDGVVASPLGFRAEDNGDQTNCATIHDGELNGNTMSYISTVGFLRPSNGDRVLDIKEALAFFPFDEALASITLKAPAADSGLIETATEGRPDESTGITEEIPYISLSPLSMRFNIDLGGDIHERFKDLYKTPVFPIVIRYKDGTSERWASSGTGMRMSENADRVLCYIPNDGEPINVSEVECIELFGDTTDELNEFYGEKKQEFMERNNITETVELTERQAQIAGELTHDLNLVKEYKDTARGDFTLRLLNYTYDGYNAIVNIEVIYKDPEKIGDYRYVTPINIVDTELACGGGGNGFDVSENVVRYESDISFEGFKNERTVAAYISPSLSDGMELAATEEDAITFKVSLPDHPSYTVYEADYVPSENASLVEANIEKITVAPISVLFDTNTIKGSYSDYSGLPGQKSVRITYNDGSVKDYTLSGIYATEHDDLHTYFKCRIASGVIDTENIADVKLIF